MSAADDHGDPVESEVSPLNIDPASAAMAPPRPGSRKKSSSKTGPIVILLLVCVVGGAFFAIRPGPPSATKPAAESKSSKPGVVKEVIQKGELV